MTIQPPGNRPREISVTEPLGAAYARMKLVLFQPFDAGKWLVIGFCAWLAQLGEAGGGGGYGYNNRTFADKDAHPLEQIRHACSLVHDYVLLNLAWLLPVVAFAALLLLALGVLFVWLSSRGQFMFLHCLAENRAEIVGPWDKHGRAANRLFLFRLVLWLAGMILILPILVVMIVLMVRMVMTGEFDFPRIFPLVGLACALALVALGLSLVQKFLVDFVVPILYLRGGTCRAACREFFQLLGAHAGVFVLYILFQILLALVLGMLVIWVVLMTCCTAGCLLVVPYIGTVVVLPILVFKRAYALLFLAQFGPAYDVFPPAAPPPLTPPPLVPVPPGLHPVGSAAAGLPGRPVM